MTTVYPDTKYKKEAKKNSEWSELVYEFINITTNHQKITSFTFKIADLCNFSTWNEEK